MDELSLAWDRVEKVLKDKYPNIQLSLGAEASKTDNFSRDDFRAPDELVEMYKRHDMNKPMFFFMEETFISAIEVPGYFSLFDANIESAPESYFDNPSDGIHSYDYYSRKAVLLPITDGARANLCVESCIDTQRKEHGRLIWMDIENDNLMFVAHSISEYLNRCAEDLEAGIYHSDDDGLHIDHSYEVSTVEYCVHRWERGSK